MWKILIVDDNLVNRKALAGILRKEATCQLVPGGREAFEALNRSIEANQPFDLILLDFNMPEMDGLEFLNQLRKGIARWSKHWAGDSVIMVTVNPEIFMRSFRSGIDDYIIKPVDGKKLIEK